MMVAMVVMVMIMIVMRFTCNVIVIDVVVLVG